MVSDYAKLSFVEYTMSSADYTTLGLTCLAVLVSRRVQLLRLKVTIRKSSGLECCDNNVMNEPFIRDKWAAVLRMK